jgi:hypothetical protein
MQRTPATGQSPLVAPPIYRPANAISAPPRAFVASAVARMVVPSAQRKPSHISSHGVAKPMQMASRLSPPPVYRPAALSIQPRRVSVMSRSAPLGARAVQPRTPPRTVLQRRPAPPVYRPLMSLQSKPAPPAYPLPGAALVQRQAASARPVIQLKWVKVRTTVNDYYWDGETLPSTPCPGTVVPNPHPPIDPRAGQKPHEGGGGFLAVGGKNRTVEIDGHRFVQKGQALDSTASTDTTSYFGDHLRVHHQGEGIETQAFGAPLPLPNSGATLGYNPHSSLAWLQRDTHQTTSRRPEKQIMGETARDAGFRLGVDLGPSAPWAHSEPDHVLPEDREDRRNRHPATEEANMRHSALEGGIRKFVKQYGAAPVGRQLNDELIPGSGIYSSMAFQVGLVNSDDVHLLVDEQPYFSHSAGRHGDSSAIFSYIEMQHFKDATRDAGWGSELGDKDDSMDEEP